MTDLTVRKKRLRPRTEPPAEPANPSGPPHILFGILDLRQGVGVEVLETLGVSRDDLRRGAQAVAE